MDGCHVFVYKVGSATYRATLRCAPPAKRAAPPESNQSVHTRTARAHNAPFQRLTPRHQAWLRWPAEDNDLLTGLGRMKPWMGQPATQRAGRLPCTPCPSRAQTDASMNQKLARSRRNAVMSANTAKYSCETERQPI